MKTHIPQFLPLQAEWLAIALLAGGPLGAAPPPPVPDLITQSGTVDRTQNFNLGPTGLRGWIYSTPASNLDSQQGRTTAASRQILVTDVGPKTPADGVIEVDNVILGAGGKLHVGDSTWFAGLMFDM